MAKGASKATAVVNIATGEQKPVKGPVAKRAKERAAAQAKASKPASEGK